jgi:sec-independent protein translocase protein TatA
MPSVGPFELIIVLVIGLLVLGPRRLPEAGKALGQGIREFKDGIGKGGATDADDAPAAKRAIAAGDDRV